MTQDEYEYLTPQQKLSFYKPKRGSLFYKPGSPDNKPVQDGITLLEQLENIYNKDLDYYISLNEMERTCIRHEFRSENLPSTEEVLDISKRVKSLVTEELNYEPWWDPISCDYYSVNNPSKKEVNEKIKKWAYDLAAFVLVENAKGIFKDWKGLYNHNDLHGAWAMGVLDEALAIVEGRKQGKPEARSTEPKQFGKKGKHGYTDMKREEDTPYRC